MLEYVAMNKLRIKGKVKAGSRIIAKRKLCRYVVDANKILTFK